MIKRLAGFLLAVATVGCGPRHASFVQSVQQRDRQHHSEYSVKGPGVGDRIKVRPQKQSWRF